MAILYAVVARGTVILAEFSAVSGNAGAVSRRLLEKLPLESESRLCFSQDWVAHSSLAYSMNDEFSRVLHQQMEYFSSNTSADTINRLQSEVSEIHTIMVDNIEKVLERGDRIELLVDKTATMQDNAFKFKKQSKRLHRALWMKNAKLLGLLICLIVLLLYIIIAAVVGQSLFHHVDLDPHYKRRT